MRLHPLRLVPLLHLLLIAACALGCGEVTRDWSDVDVAADAGAGVDASPTGASLTIDRARRWLPRGGRVELGFTVARDAATGALVVRARGLPAGVIAPDVEVAADATGGALSLEAADDAVLGAAADVTVELVDGDTVLDARTLALGVSGAPGALDETFAGRGRATAPLPDPALAATTGNAIARGAFQYGADAGADAGKIVVAAELTSSGGASTSQRIALVRFTADGALDDSFGGGAGYALLDPGPSNGLAAAGVAVDSKGRLVVAAYHVDTANVCRAYVARVTAAGAPDPDFTTFDGVPPGGYCGATRDLAIVDDDAIVLAAMWNNPDHSQLPLLMKLDARGAPVGDAFGDSWAVRMPAPTDGKRVMTPYRLRVDGEGRLLLAGMRCEGGWDTPTYTACESFVARATAAGAWDASFDGDGYRALVFGSSTSTAYQSFSGLLLDGDAILAAGWNDGATTATLARLDATGALDDDFGASGRVTPVLVEGATGQQLDDVTLDDEGRLVAVGLAASGGQLLVATRYDARGDLDESFGDGGVTTTAAAGAGPRAFVQADGRLVAVGVHPRTDGGYDVALWRFWP